MKLFVARFQFIALSALCACGDSVLFHNKKPPTHLPPHAGPVNPSPTAALPQTMSFVLDPDPALDTSTNPLEVLFKGQSYDPFQVNGAATFEVDMTMNSVEIVESANENHVDIKFNIKLKKDNATVLTRDFVSDGEVVLKNIESVDTMEGSFHDAENAGTSIAIKARRDASADAASASKHPWQGSIGVLQSQVYVPLGRLTGFAH